VDEKIPYALDDLKALPMTACIAYAGEGFSGGAAHAAGVTSRCLLHAGVKHVEAGHTELVQLLTAHFGWWDVLVENKPPVVVGEARQPTLPEDEQPV